MAQIQFEFSTRDTQLTRIERKLAEIKLEHGREHSANNESRYISLGRELFKLERQKEYIKMYDAWLKAYTKSRGL
jgi:hypothetical protein